MARRQSEQPAPDQASIPLEPGIWLEVVRVLNLSSQQAKIVELILCGACDKQIARRLSLSVATVRTYLKRIDERLGVGGRVELVVRVFVTALEITQRSCQRK